MYIRLLIFTLTVFSYISSFAQDQQEIDRLEKALYSGKKLHDSTRLDIYNELGFLYRVANNKKAKAYIDTAISIAKKTKDSVGLCGAYNRMGLVYKATGRVNEAIEYYKKSIEIARRIKDFGRIADVYNNMGNLYRMQGNYTLAIESLLEALKMRELERDTFGIGAAYNNIAYTYADQENFDKAIENNGKAIEYFIAAKDSFELSRAYGFLGYVYYATDKFEDALKYNKLALSIFEKFGDKAESALTLNNIGNILAETGKPSEATTYHERALAIQLANQDTLGIFTSYLSLSQAYLFSNNTAKAESYVNKCLNILAVSPGNTIKMHVDAYEMQAKVLAAAGKYKEALTARDRFEALKDSMVNTENSRAVLDMQEKYESDKKDMLLQTKALELNLASSKIKQRNTIAIVLIVFIISIIIVGYLLYNRYKLRKQQEFNEALIHQQAIRSKAIIEAEEKERTRIAKDLHDGLGQQLSAVKLMINAIRAEQDEKEKAQKLETLSQLTDDSVKEVRAVSHNMMPNALLRMGLASAVREFIDKISSTGLLKINLQIVGLTQNLDKTTESVLYRVIQELVNNIIKHADANQLDIQIINHDDETLNIVVEDNGRGFDTKNINNFKGIGLKNMISRIEYLNGTITFDSTPGRGTTVIIDVPHTSDSQ